jgi:hypothetical protein
MNEHIRKLIAHSSECNINGYGYCDCGADPDRYLSEKDVKKIVNRNNEAFEHLRATVKLLQKIKQPKKQKLNKKWVGLTEDEIVGHTCECVDDGTFNMKCAIDFARSIESKLKDKNT